MQRFEAGYAAVNAEAIVACFATRCGVDLARLARAQWPCSVLGVLEGTLCQPLRPQVLGLAHERAGPDRGAKLQGERAAARRGPSVTLDGTDVYQIRDGLIARKDAYWKQIGAAQTCGIGCCAHRGLLPQGVVVPLRVGTAAHAQALTELFKRLAASPALLQAAQSGLLRFDMRVDEAAVKAVADAAPAARRSRYFTSAMAATTAARPGCLLFVVQGRQGLRMQGRHL
jgi:hypothetical protein